MKEMQSAAAAAVVAALADLARVSARMNDASHNGHASAWVIQGRIRSADRWLG